MRLLLLLVLVAIALAAQAPAWLLARQVRDASAGVVDVRNATGTLWNGRADLVVRPTASAPEANAGSVLWKVQRFDMSRTAWIIDIRQSPAAPRPMQMIVNPGFDRIDVAGSVRLPLDVAGAVPILAGWTVTGEATADTDALQWLDGRAAGSVIARWQGARLVPPDLPGGFALGDVNATITMSPAVVIRVRNAGGDVDLQIDASSQARTIALLAQPRATTSAAQLAWLQSHTMGRGPGGFRVDVGWPGR